MPVQQNHDYYLYVTGSPASAADLAWARSARRLSGLYCCVTSTKFILSFCEPLALLIVRRPSVTATVAV